MKLDEPLCFYMRHREQIEEWMELRNRLGREVERLLLSVGAALEERSKSLDRSPLLLRATKDPCRKLFFYLPSWTSGDIGPDRTTASWRHLRLAIGMEWTKRGLFFETPYYGVWFNRNHSELAEVNDPLRPPLADLATQRGWKSSAWWPIYRYTTLPAGEYWTDLESLREHYISEIVRCWMDYAPVVAAHFPSTS